VLDMTGHIRLLTSAADYPVTPDAVLISAVRDRGDEAAFRELYRRHTPDLYRLVMRLNGGRPRDAEEVVQDTWVSAVESLARFRGEAQLRTWLGAIAVNRLRDSRRRMKRWRFLSLQSAPASHAPRAPLEERMDIATALARLPDGYRAVLVLHDIEGFTHEEIGQMLDVTSGTSKAQLFSARRAMRQLLAGEETR
jgi:RNA polymerase sigma-70 factor (ECF subfamily)